MICSFRYDLASSCSKHMDYSAVMVVFCVCVTLMVLVVVENIWRDSLGSCHSQPPSSSWLKEKENYTAWHIFLVTSFPKSMAFSIMTFVIAFDLLSHRMLLLLSQIDFFMFLPQLSQRHCFRSFYSGNWEENILNKYTSKRLYVVISNGKVENNFIKA